MQKALFDLPLPLALMIPVLNPLSLHSIHVDCDRESREVWDIPTITPKPPYNPDLNVHSWSFPESYSTFVGIYSHLTQCSCSLLRLTNAGLFSDAKTWNGGYTYAGRNCVILSSVHSTFKALIRFSPIEKRAKRICL